MKDYSDFLITTGKKPYWRVKPFKDYIETLTERELISYILGLHEFIKEKGIKSEDRTFLKKLGYDESISDIFTLGQNVNYSNKVQDEIFRLRNKYFEPWDYGVKEIDFSLVMISFMATYNSTNKKRSNKKRSYNLKFKDHSKEKEFIKEFKETFEYMIGFNYTKEKVSEYIYYQTDISLKLTTIFEYLDSDR